MSRLGSWRTTVSLIAAIGMAGLGAPASGRDTIAIGPDEIGETLKQFHSFHKDAVCTRRPIEEFNVEKFRATESSWVDCNIRKTAAPAGQKLLIDADPTRPFGVLATFYKRRLTELSYTLAATSIEPLLPTLERQYGKPNRVTRDNMGQVDSATWLSRTVELDLSVATIPPASADERFLRLGDGLPGKAIRMRIIWRKSHHDLQTEADSR